MKRRPTAWLAVMAAGTILLPACANTTPTGGETPTSGGTLTISFKDDLKTLDPAIGYDTDSWSIERQIYNGLLDYDGFTTNLKGLNPVTTHVFHLTSPLFRSAHIRSRPASGPLRFHRGSDGVPLRRRPVFKSVRVAQDLQKV